ncbi:MAG: BT4734/BF3469 family protein [Bacteroidales bacterium]|jgi:hypothetical protein
MKVSFFKDVKSKKAKDIDISEVFEIIKSEKLFEQIQKVRNAQTKEEKEAFKKQLPSITTSGTFKESHSSSDLIEHSGLIQIDIDKIDNLEDLQEKINKDELTHASFISPSGNGLKIIVKILPDKNNHLQNFQYLEKYYLQNYNLSIDKSCKDVSRLMFLSSDKNIYVNDNSKMLDISKNQETSKLETDVEKIINQIEKQKIDITGSYDNWLKIGFAIANGFDENGRNYFHRISKYSKKYDECKCNKQFDECLKQRKQGITIKSFFKIAKESGINISPVIKDNNVQPDSITNSSGSEKIEPFYSPIYDNNNNIKDLKINYKKFIELLYSFGFKRFDIDTDFIFIKIDNQVIQQVTITQIQDYFIKYVKSLPEKLYKGVKREFLLDKFYRNPGNYFCENKLSLLTPDEQIVFNKDTKHSCFFYFKNGFIECNKEGFNLKPYSELTGHIWKNQILERNFERINDLDDLQSDFIRFIYNICNNDKERILSLSTIIGYILHTYFEGKLKAAIFTDSKISEKPDGRTGKTLLCKSLGKMKNYCEINGKDFKPEDKHKYQEASIDTQIVNLNDVRSNFNFENLYNDITEFIKVEKKNAHPFKLRAKIIITTNKTIDVDGASSKDRCVEFEFSEHYSDKYSPYDEFGKWFFVDWDKTDWNIFDNYMMFCVWQYFEKGLIIAKSINLNKRKIIDCTCPEFVEFIEEKIKYNEIIIGQEYDKKEIHQKFLEEYSELKENKFYSNQRTFIKWLKKFALHSEGVGDLLIERKSGNNRYFSFTQKIIQQ